VNRQTRAPSDWSRRETSATALLAQPRPRCDGGVYTGPIRATSKAGGFVPVRWTGSPESSTQNQRQALWHFWSGPDREFDSWYVNIQEAFRRTSIGFDTQDLELDIVVPLDGAWEFKDRDLLDAHVARGRYTEKQVDRVLALGDELGAELDAGHRWWDEKWSTWTPDPAWRPVALPPDWKSVPTTT